MSRDNPDGWKLEELLNQIRFELSEKNKLIQDDGCQVSKIVRANNIDIIELLFDCVTMQKESMDALDTLGEKQGATDKPRIGG